MRGSALSKMWHVPHFVVASPKSKVQSLRSKVFDKYRTLDLGLETLDSDCGTSHIFDAGFVQIDKIALSALTRWG